MRSNTWKPNFQRMKITAAVGSRRGLRLSAQPCYTSNFQQQLHEFTYFLGVIDIVKSVFFFTLRPHDAGPVASNPNNTRKSQLRLRSYKKVTRTYGSFPTTNW